MSTQPTTRPATRFLFLDGIRALAAWYVVLHHMWIESFPGFPRNTGPAAVGWLRWGHVAVAVFIVLSGFSLSLVPARHGDRVTGGPAEFIRRRAWRILPTYWVALFLSFVALVLFTGRLDVISLRSVVVYGLLLQDLVGAQTPNGAFWSIALEWHLYFLFPGLLLAVRRWGPTVTVITTTAAVTVLFLLSSEVEPLRKIGTLTPQFLVLFTFGLVAGRSVVRHGPAGDAVRRGLGLGVSTAVVAVAFVFVLTAPDRLMVADFYLLDLVVGALVASLCYSLARGALPGVAGVLGSGPMVLLGSFSYSVYLIHAPIFFGVMYWVADPLTSTRMGRFLVLLVVGVPAVAAGSYALFRLVERPSMERRWPRVPGLRRVPAG
ncbi:MAG: acyltransferase family protein [Microthrixaceae bacterium]